MLFTSLESLFADGLDQLGPFEPSPHFAIALSGGADSMALLALVESWVAQHGGRITALTVDHRLRDESTNEAQQIGAWMHARSIAHVILTPEHAADDNNLPARARNWRYDALAAWCRTNHVLHCLVAHHADDQRETIALATARGETEDGPSGMSAIKLHGHTRFLRPLLTCNKKQLIDYLQAHGTAWVEDPSNRDLTFARARLRAEPSLLPLPMNARTKREAAFSHAAVACITLHPLGHCWLDAAAWQAKPAALQSQLLADLLTTISGNIHRPRKPDTQRLLAQLMDPQTTRATLHGCLIERVGKRWRVARELARCAAPITMQGTGEAEWDSRFRIKHALPEGTAFTLQTLGQAGRWALKTLNHPAAAELPLSAPSIWHLDQLLMLPHMFAAPEWPANARLSVGFAPPKPLAAQGFWWLNAALTKE